MGRARTIKPAFFLNCELGELPALARLLFVGLWTLADRDGLLKDEPKKIKIQLLPWDECDVNELLNHLKVGNFIQRYEADGIACIEILNFAKHQNIHPKEASSNLPFHLKKCKKISFPGKKVIKGRIVKEGIEVKEGLKEEGPPVESSDSQNQSPVKKRLVPEIPEDHIPETLRTPEFVEAFADWKQHKRERGETYKPTGLAALLKKLDALGPEAAAAAISHSIAANYAGIYPAPSVKQLGPQTQPFKTAHERKLEREAAAIAEFETRTEQGKNAIKRTNETRNAALRPVAERRTNPRAPGNSGPGLARDILRRIPVRADGAFVEAPLVPSDTGRPPGIGKRQTAVDSEEAGRTSRDAERAEGSESLGASESEDRTLTRKLETRK